MPSILTVSSISRMASTAAPSAFSFSPRPTQRAAASAPYSVTRTSSIARLRSGRAPAASGIARNLQDAGGLAPAYALGLSDEAAESDARRAHETHHVPDLDRDVYVVRIVAAGPAEDDAVDEDQREGRDADDHRHLARPPCEVVPAGDDVGEDERRHARGHEQPVEDAVGPERREAATVAVQRGVRVAALGVAAAVAARREPRQEERDEEDRRADEADDLRALHAPDVERRPGLLLLLELRLVEAGARPAAERSEEHADAHGYREQPDLRVGE